MTVLRNLIVLSLAVAVLILALVLPNRWDRILRRTMRTYKLGEVVKEEDGLWYRVMRVTPTNAPHDRLFGDVRTNVLLRRLTPSESAVYEFMSS